MRINNSNNDQNIRRLCTKMSEHFSSDESKKGNLSNLIEFFEKGQNSGEKPEGNLSYDHMYTSTPENGEINLPDSSCQTAESEVKFWKEWLILHLDLIQQQSDEILNKERTILILQQENEMLKERISCMERGAPFQPKRFFNNRAFLAEALDMTQDPDPCDEDNKNCLNLHPLNLENGQKHSLSDGESQTENPSINQFDSQVNYNKISDKLDSDIRDCNTSARLGFSLSSGELDPMRNLRMSIRRKRLSNSSAVSNNDSVGEEKRSFRKFKKRRKRVIKDSQILTTGEHYITDGNKNARVSNLSDAALDIANDETLEVPRWRIKVYASCYAMEGTENLDDEVYNKRHSRLENDERRRKRWDVQRIREQRLIEKLKQRQDRNSRMDERNEPMQSFWPNVDDVKYLEVSEQLPVSAFGSPMPKVQPSDFTLPWLNNPSLLITKKVPAKRSTTVRRRTAKR